VRNNIRANCLIPQQSSYSGFVSAASEEMADVALIQEPLIYRGQLRGIINSVGTIISVASQSNAKSSFYVKNHINTPSSLWFCSRDATMARMWCPQLEDTSQSCSFTSALDQDVD
jgi:hypothetical protein